MIYAALICVLTALLALREYQWRRHAGYACGVIRDVEARASQLQATVDDISYAAVMSPDELLHLRAGVRTAERLATMAGDISMGDLALLGDDVLQSMALVIAKHRAIRACLSDNVDALLTAKEQYLAGDMPEDEFERYYAVAAEDPPSNADEAIVLSACQRNGVNAFTMAARKALQEHPQ